MFTCIRRISKQKIKYFFLRKMSDNTMIGRVRNIVPELNNTKHKGQAGRIGVIGGSLEYTGAPYFAAISSLKVGADLVHVFCTQNAAPVIKSYSPELIVHPLLDVPYALSSIEPWLERLHVVLIGPGLGRDKDVLETVSSIINACRVLNKPLVIDADGLFLITQNKDLIKDYDNVILTPNAAEFTRLFGNRCNVYDEIAKFGTGVTVLEKGLHDRIYNAQLTKTFICDSGGSGRRCGGQGDLLSGAIATFFHWAILAKDIHPAVIACFASSLLIKECNLNAFNIKGRSMLASDMIEQIHTVFAEQFELIS